MSNPAFIVEGVQERKIIQNLCPDIKGPIRLIPNGEKVPIKIIADRIYYNIKSFSERNYPILVIFDREDRIESTDSIINEISKNLELKKRNITENIIFGVPDKTLESWIIPFIDESGNFKPEPSSGFEGTKNWKNELKRRIRMDGNDYEHYSETGTGVDMFLKYVIPYELAKVSPSFKKFYVETKTRFPNCRWFN